MQQLKEIIKNNHRSKQEWLIENLIPKREIIIAYAPSNHYKTCISTKIALEVVTGSQDLGATEIGRVLIFSPDCSEMRLRPRIRAMANEVYSTQKQDILENLYINWDNNLDITSDGWGVITDSRKETYKDHYGYDQTKWVEFERTRRWDEQRRLGDSIIHDWVEDYYEVHDEDEEFPYKPNVLIIIDTLSKVIGANSTNDDKAMRVAIDNLSQIIKGSKKADVSILVLAHASSKSVKGIMGSSTQGNDVTTVLRIKKKKKCIGEIVREKFKGSFEGKSIPFKIRETVIDGIETVYADIGSELGEWERVILNFYDEGLDADNIKDNTYEILGQQYKSKKSFNVVYGRKLKALINKGFIKEDNKATKDNS